MKKLLTLLFFISASFVFAQKRPALREVPSGHTIEVTNNKYFVNGEQYGTAEIKRFLQNNNYKAYALFKKGKSKGALGGFFLGLGSALIIADAAKGISSDVKYPSFFTYTGAAFVATSIPILSGRKKLVDQGIQMYNDGLKTTGALDTPTYSFDFVSNSNGLGFCFRF